MCPKCLVGELQNIYPSSPPTRRCNRCHFEVRKLAPDELEKVKTKFREDYFTKWQSAIDSGEYTEEQVEDGFLAAWERGMFRYD